MRIALTTFLILIVVADFALGSQFNCGGLKREFEYVPPPDVWESCLHANLIAEVRVLEAKRPLVAGVDGSRRSRHAATLSLRVLRALKGGARTRLPAAELTVPDWELPPSAYKPGQRAVAWMFGNEVDGWFIDRWVPTPEAGEDRRSLRVLIQEALSLQARRPDADQWQDEWWTRARQHHALSDETHCTSQEGT